MEINKLDKTIENEGKTRQNAENTQTFDLTLFDSKFEKQLSQELAFGGKDQRTNISRPKTLWRRVTFSLPAWQSKISKCTTMPLHEQYMYMICGFNSFVILVIVNLIRSRHT